MVKKRVQGSIQVAAMRIRLDRKVLVVVLSVGTLLPVPVLAFVAAVGPLAILN